MPYIKAEQRHDIMIEGRSPCTPGELNFVLTKVVCRYIHERGLSYTTANEIVGTLDACKLEFYRRIVVPYEQCKQEENGDVSDL